MNNYNFLHYNFCLIAYNEGMLGLMSEEQANFYSGKNLKLIIYEKIRLKIALANIFDFKMTASEKRVAAAAGGLWVQAVGLLRLLEEGEPLRTGSWFAED